MKTTTKSEILKNFENEKYAKPDFPNNMDENETLYMRSEISKIYHFNCIYKDGKKYYLENSVDAIFRLAKRCKVEIDHETYDELEYCFYLADYNMQEAKKIYQRRYC